MHETADVSVDGAAKRSYYDLIVVALWRCSRCQALEYQCDEARKDPCRSLANFALYQGAKA